MLKKILFWVAFLVIASGAEYSKILSVQSSSPGKHIGKSFILFTHWVSSERGNTVRFKAKVTPKEIDYRGESKRMADDYGLFFDGMKFRDDHMVGNQEMRCKYLGNERYTCYAQYGDYRKATVLYKVGKNGRFDLRFYGVPVEGGVERYVLRLYSDGKYLYEQYFENGRLRHDITRRYPIATIQSLR